MRAPEFWRHDGLAPALLAPFAWAYAAAGQARRAMAQPVRVAIPVVCIGNLVAGGAGKTPVALSIGERLAKRGYDVHFLTRGYGGRVRELERVEPHRHSARDVGDEALLLARVAPTWVTRYRVAGARAAADAGAELVIMDDGFQNPTIAKDLSLVVIDGDYGFGNGRVLPAGPLRETPAEGLARADAVVFIGDPPAGWDDSLTRRGIAVLHATVEPLPDSERLAGKAVVAFAGIARPERFFATLAKVGCQVVGARTFPDHHRYDPDEIMTLVEMASELGAVPVTTEKDFVRLPEEARLMVQAVRVRLVWRDPEAIDRLLAPLLPRA